MDKYCDERLESAHIVATLTAGNTAMEAKTLDCLKKHFYEVLLGVLLRKKLSRLSDERQTLIAEESFNDAYETFREKVLSGNFDASRKERSTTYFSRILYFKFRNNLDLKHNRGLFAELNEDEHTVSPTHMSYDSPLLNTTDGINELVLSCVSQMDDEPRKYMTWVNLEGLSDEKIMQLTGLNKDQVKRKIRRYEPILLKLMQPHLN